MAGRTVRAHAMVRYLQLLFFMTRTEQATWRDTAMHLIRKGRVMMASPDHLDRLAGESMVAMGRMSLADANRLQRHLLNCLAQTQR